MILRYFPLLIVPILVVFFHADRAKAATPASPLHQLLILKHELEGRYGISRLECFPFLKTIQNATEETEWVNRCLTGVATLREALTEVPETGLSTIGVSTRFLRTGGFGTLLIPWDASLEKMVEELKRRTPAADQEVLLAQVRKLKQKIMTRFLIRDLFCSQTLSNDQCLNGYTTLASLKPEGDLAHKNWGQVVVSDSLVPGEDPTRLLLRYDQSPEAMADRLLNAKAQDFFDERRHVYDTMTERHGQVFERVLQVPNVFCAPDLTSEECLKGAALLHMLSQNHDLTDRPWGRVWINRHLTRVQNDYEVSLRFDESREEATRWLVDRPNKEEVAAHVTLAEKLEGRLKNNSSGLRAVCDLHRLRSDLCVKGFETFVRFLKDHRDYKVASPWTTVMFVDPTQLDRVNFALNSGSRDTYLYIDAGADVSELTRFLENFGSKGN